MTPSTESPSLSALQAGIVPKLQEVRDTIRSLIEDDFGLIAEVNSHLLQMHGKMLRPTLTLLTHGATVGDDPRVARLAAVVELIHLATLIHDDSVDHSVLRRGMPTINSLFSHQVSVIMGDYLYSRAVIELVRLADLDALGILGRVTNEMTIGEMRQLLAHDPIQFTEADYDLLIRSKTASLMSGACEVGCLRASSLQREAAASFGYYLGMAFQITDDLLDFESDPADTGKPVGLDLREHKVTLPLIFALPRMNQAQRAATDNLMAVPEPTDAQIAEVTAAIRNCGGLEYARQRAHDSLRAAEAELDNFSSGSARDALAGILAYVIERRS